MDRAQQRIKPRGRNVMAHLRVEIPEIVDLPTANN
jgi:hypothetical protein